MKKIHLSIRMRFILMIMSELICVSFVSWLVMDVLHISDIPYTVWIIISSVIAVMLSVRWKHPVS